MFFRPGLLAPSTAGALGPVCGQAVLSGIFLKGGPKAPERLRGAVHTTQKDEGHRVCWLPLTPGVIRVSADALFPV